MSSPSMSPLSSLPLTTPGLNSGQSSLPINPSTSPSMSPLTSSIAGAMLGGVGAGLFQQPTNTTGNYSNSSTGNATTTRNLTPAQTAVQQPLYQQIMNLMTNPQAVLAPYQTAARNQVNDNYTGLADTLRQQFLSTGGGSSGKFGMALANANVGRLGQLSNVDNQFAQEAASLPITAGAPLAEQLLGMNFGSTTSSSNSSSGTQTSQTSQGNPVSTGLGTFAKILGAMFL